MDSLRRRSIWFLFCFLIVSFVQGPVAGNAPILVPKFDLKKSRLELERYTRLGTFFDVTGRKSALFGYENRSFEAWVYPLKVLDDFSISFQLRGYPLDIQGAD